MASGSHGAGVRWGGLRACRSTKAWLGFFASRAAPQRLGSEPLVLPWTDILEECVAAVLALQFPWSSVLPRPGSPFLPQSTGRWPALQSRLVLVVGEAQREVGRQWEAEAACGPGGQELVSGYWELTGGRRQGADLCKWRWLVLGAEDIWLVPRLPLEKWLEGGRRLEKGASLGLFCLSTVEGETRSRCCPVHCFGSNSASAFHGNGVTLSRFPFLRL